MTQAIDALIPASTARQPPTAKHHRRTSPSRNKARLPIADSSWQLSMGRSGRYPGNLVAREGGWSGTTGFETCKLGEGRNSADLAEWRVYVGDGTVGLLFLVLKRELK